MNTSALVVIWSWFGLSIAGITAGIWFHGTTYGVLLGVAGGLGLLVWVIGVLWLATAMNTDI